MTPVIDLRTATDSEIVDLAGRQRMLNQRVMKEFLARLVGAPETLVNPQVTSTILRTTAERLARGGPISMRPGMPPDMRISPLDRADIAENFEEQIALSVRVVEAGQTLLSMADQGPAVAEQLSHLLALGDDFHRVADTAVKLLAVHYQERKAALEEAERELTSSMKQIWSVITVQSDELVASSSRLTSNSQAMSLSAGDTSGQARFASDAVVQIQGTVGSVAAALEEMSATTREVSSRTSEAAHQATLAAESVQDAGQVVARLAESGEQIGEVVSFIEEVAEHTNLLALNAKIEAARAGDAGRGFGVVANEVRELAKQTAEATKEITARINSIQQDADAAGTSIREMEPVVGLVLEMSTGIAAAVTEHEAATQEITNNLGTAVRSLDSISSAIQNVANAAEDVAASASDSNAAAQELEELARHLSDAASQVKPNDSDSGA